MRAFFKLLLQTPFFPCKHCLRPSWKIQTWKSPQQTPPLLASQPGSQPAAGCGIKVAAQLHSCTKDRAVKPVGSPVFGPIRGSSKGLGLQDKDAQLHGGSRGGSVRSLSRKDYFGVFGAI